MGMRAEGDWLLMISGDMLPEAGTIWWRQDQRKSSPSLRSRSISDTGPALRSKGQMAGAFHAPREHMMISTTFEADLSPDPCKS